MHLSPRRQIIATETHRNTRKGCHVCESGLGYLIFPSFPHLPQFLEFPLVWTSTANFHPPLVSTVNRIPALAHQTHKAAPPPTSQQAPASLGHANDRSHLTITTTKLKRGPAQPIEIHRAGFRLCAAQLQRHKSSPRPKGIKSQAAQPRSVSPQTTTKRERKKRYVPESSAPPAAGIFSFRSLSLDRES